MKKGTKPFKLNPIGFDWTIALNDWTVFLNVFLRLIFNLKKKKDVNPLTWDKFIIGDILFSSSIFLVYFFITTNDWELFATAA